MFMLIIGLFFNNSTILVNSELDVTVNDEIKLSNNSDYVMVQTYSCDDRSDEIIGCKLLLNPKEEIEIVSDFTGELKRKRNQVVDQKINNIFVETLDKPFDYITIDSLLSDEDVILDYDSSNNYDVTISHPAFIDFYFLDRENNLVTAYSYYVDIK